MYDLEEEACELANSLGYFPCGVWYTVLDLSLIHYYVILLQTYAILLT